MPDLTLIIACYEMPRQVANVLTSALPPYQQDVSDDVSVVLIDNGSRTPVPDHLVPDGVEHRRIAPDDAHPYPGPAINRAVRDATTPLVGVMIDGARLLTPGVLAGALDALSRWPDAVVDVKGWHLGDRAQQDALADGEDPTDDQQLLAQVGWPEDGHRLFDICAPTFCTRDGFLAPGNESSALFTARDRFLASGGYDERFVTSGGGLANIDLWWRLAPDARPVITLLGEGTFHQAHGGASTGLARPELSERFQEWREEYEELTGRSDVGPPPHDPLLLGRMGAAARRVQAAALEQHEPREADR